MIINNVELENLDFYNPDVMEKVEKFMEKASNMKDETRNCKSLSDFIRKSCNLIFEGFNDIFGPGTDKKIFGDRVNLKTCLVAFDEFTNELEKQNEELLKIVEKKTNTRNFNNNYIPRKKRK